MNIRGEGFPFPPDQPIDPEECVPEVMSAITRDDALLLMKKSKDALQGDVREYDVR